MSRLALLRIGLAVLSVSLLPAGAWAEPPSPLSRHVPGSSYFNFFWSDPEPPPPVRPIHPQQVGAILRREGTRMIGAPRLRGLEIIAVGREPSGAERRFTLDAETGEVLTVTLSRAAPERPRPPIDANAPIDRALGAPVHPAGNLDADHLGTPPPPAPPEQVAPPPPPKQVEAPPPPVQDADAAEGPEDRPADPDAALSPIKPLKPAAKAPGAPKVEKLPQ